MTAAADLILTNARVHTLTSASLATAETPDAEAVAVRDGRIVRIGSAYDLRFLDGIDTRVIDLDDRVVLPGFIDAHTHLRHTGERLTNADLTSAESRTAALDQLAAYADTTEDDWILGVGYDDSGWSDGTLTQADLDAIDRDQPVAAIRVDQHRAVCNRTALAYCREHASEQYVEPPETPPGAVVEDAVGIIREAVAPGESGTAAILKTAIDYAVARGITGVHEKTRSATVARVYRERAQAGDLPIRVRLDYWVDFLEALREVGVRTNYGSDRVTVGAIKLLADGSVGARTARFEEPYADTTHRGEWVHDPAAVETRVNAAVDAGFQVAVHAIGDAAVTEIVDTLAAAEGERHRIEHAEFATDEAIERMATAGVIASVQPNFLRWAGADGLYAQALGSERATQADRIGQLDAAGVPLAFGSDGMPLDPLYGIEQVVTAPTTAQALPVGTALRAYTHGSAYAGFDEDRLGTIESGKRADLVALEASPWERSSIEDIDVAMTVVDGAVVHDAR